MADTVHGSGPRPCSWAVVGTEPGFREMKRGEVFVGPTGEELFRLLALIGRNRKNTFLTNLFREPPPAKKVPHTEEQWAYGLACLKRELAEVRPRHIITLGAPIARLFLGDDVDLDECWGLHLKPSDEARELFALRPDCTLFPQVHPAAGFHSPEASSRVLVGFEDMQRKLEDGEPARGLYDDEYPNPLYRYATYVEDLGHWLEPNLPIALDTEGYNHAPWSVQASTSGGSAILIRNTQTDELGALRRRIAAAPSVIMHAGLHDLSVLRQLGIDLIEMGVPFDDTQLMAYLLNVEPQGLKPLMTRHCGMRVRSYQEVLGDAQDRHTRTYLAALWEKLHARHEQFRREDFHYQTVRLGRRIKKLPEHPKTNLHKAVERVLGSKAPSKLWAAQVEDYRVEAYRWMGDEVPEASLSDVPPDVALDYACKDPDGTGRIAKRLRSRLRALGLEDVYKLDLSTYPIIDRMMRVGITPDVEAFASLGSQLDGEIAAVLRRIREATGESDFNPNSGDQVAEYLFDALGVEPMGKRTESGRESTNDKVLEALQHAYPEHEAIGDIRTYREYYKLRWTFIERLPKLVKRWPHDGRIHCDLMMTRTPSGRLAAKAPNLLAMPKHGKFAKAFRRCFVPGAGRLFLSADESQVELRVGAHLSQDPVMLDIFAGRRRNPDGSLIDLHAAMVQRVTGKDPRDQSDADRLVGKAINFGYWMGQTAIGLTLELRKSGLNIDEDDAQRWIDEANALYVGAVTYKERMVAEATKNGYVRCLSGRIRYIGGIRSRDERVRAEAERFAYSTPVQEGAQWVAKQALKAAWDELFVPLRKQGRWVEPVLWIHDDLLSEADPETIMEMAPKLQAIMTRQPKGFTVPLRTTPEAGMNWADLTSL